MGWESLLGIVQSLLPVLEARKDHDHDRATEALEALADAFYETAAYYESGTTGSNARRRAQIEIARKWDRVANLMRPFDNNLWSRFNLKSRFWYEGEAWTAEQIRGANIGLERVRQDARFLLISKQRSANK